MEELLYQQISKDPVLFELLAKYRGNMGFFYQKCPMDEDPFWEKPCFPRMDYSVDWKGDGTGTLTIHVTVNTDCLGDIEKDIQSRLVTLIHGTFYTIHSGTFLYASWLDVTSFAVKGSDQNAELSPVEVYGLTLTFSLTPYLKKEFSHPDPVLGAERWTKEHFPEIQLLSEGDFPPVWQPSPENPLIFWSFDHFVGNSRQTYAVNWYTATLTLHCFTGHSSSYQHWVKAIAEELQACGEILLLDDSPFFIQKVETQVNQTLVHMTVTGEYGVLATERKEFSSLRLLNPVINLHENKFSWKPIPKPLSYG